METLRRQLPLAVVALLIAAALWYGPIVQPDAYHSFADQSTYYDIAHFSDVISNLGFALVAICGAFLLRRGKRMPSLAHSWTGYRLFLTGLFLTALGSAYYHLEPNNARLVWDRLPIALTCGGLLAGVWADARQKSADLLTTWMAVLAAYSVAWWYVTDLIDVGDLRPYLMFQIVPMLLIPLLQWIYRSPAYDRLSFGVALLFYAAAKFAEMYDHEIAAQLGTITGHTLKHLLATLAAAVIVGRLAVRQRSASRRSVTQRTQANVFDCTRA